MGIQTNLINLYSNNLSAVATQAALIAGFSFSAVIATNSANNTDDVEVIALSYFYYVFFTICLVTALFILSQATIVVMFGPTLALKGATDDAVKFAAAHMMNQQLIILRAAYVSITSLFVGSCILCWANYPVGIATLCTIVYLVSYYYLVMEGYAAYRIFVPEDSNAFVEPLMDANGTVIAGGPSSSGGISASTPSFRLMTSSTMEAKDDAQAEKVAAINANLQQAQEVRNLLHATCLFMILLFLPGNKIENQSNDLEASICGRWWIVCEILWCFRERPAGLVLQRKGGISFFILFSQLKLK